LAYLKRETGHDQVLEALDAESAISTVNLAEVFTKVVSEGRAFNPVADRLAARGLTIHPFTEEDARTAAAIYPQTQPLGLSLGDRSCLALGLRLRLPVITADRAWTQLQIGVSIRSIR
jgi:ribonuclease VapC